MNRPNVSEEYKEFAGANNPNNTQTNSEWKPTGLDLDYVIENNSNLLDSYNISLTGMTPQDFYFDGNVWDATVLSNDNIPYKVIITSDFEVLLNPLTDNVLEGESE